MLKQSSRKTLILNLKGLWVSVLVAELADMVNCPLHTLSLGKI